MEAINPAQAVNVLWHITIRLARLWMYSALVLAHVVLLVLVLLALWAFQISAASVQSAFLHMQGAAPVAVFAALGGSAATLVALYWKLLKWVHGPLAGRFLSSYLMRGMPRK